MYIVYPCRFYHDWKVEDGEQRDKRGIERAHWGRDPTTETH